MRFAAELFKSQASFVYGTGRGMVDVLAKYREGTPHGEGLESQNDFYSGTVGNALYEGEILPQQAFIHDVAWRGEQIKVYHII